MGLRQILECSGSSAALLLYKVIESCLQRKGEIKSYLSGKMAFDAGELESAISSVIFEIVEREKSVSSAASQVRYTNVVSIATVVFQCVILSAVV